MVLATARSVGTHRHDDIGPQGPDVTHEVAEDLLTPPLLERFLLAERVAKIHCAREVLLGAIEAMRREELLGPEDAQRVEELRADLVLSAVAARGRDERHPRAEMPRVERQHGVVLVVGVRGHVHDRADGRELPQAPAETPARRSGRSAVECDTGERAAGRRRATAARPPRQPPRPGNRDNFIGSPREGRFETVTVSCPSVGFGQLSAGELPSGTRVSSSFVYTRCQPALRRPS